MNPARIAELLEPFLGPTNDQRITTNDFARISTYIDLLLRWNARINLTAIRNPEEIVTRHFGESLFAARHLFPGRRIENDGIEESVGTKTNHVGTAALGCPSGQSPAAAGTIEDASHCESAERFPANDQRRKTNDAITLADLGSGAGFPGLPIKLWAPEISITLIESNHKKVAFLREAARALTFTNINIQNVRAEALTTTFEVVTLRAVENFKAILPTAAALLASGASLALLISSPQVDDAKATLPHLTWSNPIPIPESRTRMLTLATRTK
jgi:16S rRNA (guanine527-N7)-methyltransferase